MKIKNILCPVDFSKPSEAAVVHASALARRYAATLHFVYVYEPVFTDGYMSGMPANAEPIDIEPIRERLEAIRPAGAGEVKYRHEMVFGFPGGSLVLYASTNEIDLIVMGTHGREGASRLLLGSVAETVVRSAGCPVLTVHDSRGALDLDAV